MLLCTHPACHIVSATMSRQESEFEELRQLVREANASRERAEASREQAEQRVKEEAASRRLAEQRVEEEEASRRLAEQRVEEEEASRRLAEQRVEKSESRTRKTTLPEFLDACHIYLSLGLAVQEASLSTQGDPANARNKLRPEKIRSWTEFPQQLESIWRDLMDSDFVNERHFSSLQYLEESGDKVRKRQLSSEDDLSFFERLTVEDQVALIIELLYLSPTLRASFCLNGSVNYHNHANMLSSESIEESIEGLRIADKQARRSKRLQSRKKQDRAKSVDSTRSVGSAASAAKDKAFNAPRADQFCVYNTSNESTETKVRVAAYIIEYKAPHKLSLGHIYRGLEDVDLEEVVLQQDDESPQICSRRLIAAAISQTFSYMVRAGLEYGYVCTGEAFVFLRVPDDPTTVYYFLSVPNRDVGDATGWQSDSDQKNRLHLTAVGQVLAFTLQALRTPPRNPEWRTRAAAKLKPWEVVYEDILQAIPKYDTPSSVYQPSPSMDAYLRLSPVRTRSRRVSTASCHSLQSLNQPDNDDFDPDTPSRPPQRSVPAIVQPAPSSSRAGDASTNNRTQSRSRQYCTQRCLLGLGGFLDKDCPNAHDHGLDRHQIDRPTFLRLLRKQLSTNLDTDVINLGVWGARGALFKVTLTSHGYTVVAKATSAHLVQYLEHEAKVYRRLQSIQGIHVPVCLGSVDLIRTYPYEGVVGLVHMILLSFGGRPIRWYLNTGNRANLIESARCSMKAIHELGVIHRDAMPRNMLWSVEINRVMVIDFERAEIASDQPRTALGQVSPNRKRKRGTEGEKGSDAFSNELRLIARELQVCNNTHG